MKKAKKAITILEDLFWIILLSVVPWKFFETFFLESLEIAIERRKKMSEPLTLEQLKEVPHGKIKESTLKNICDRANEIAYPPAHIDREAWTAKWVNSMPILGAGDLETRCVSCGNLVLFETPFCPYCGKAMTEEAWEELEKRMKFNG